MKAVQFTDFGTPDVLHLAEIATPTPKDDEVLVKVAAAHVNFGDLLARNFKSVSPRQFSMPFILWLPSRLVFGIRKPNIKVLGNEFAGTVAGVGKNVTHYQVGDRVFGYRGQKMGAYAEYVVMPQSGMLTHMPNNMTYAEATAVPYGALTALTLLRKAHIHTGQKVLIHGASGGIGSFAVQLAKHFGAEVTGVCSTPRVELVKALGADHVIDYTRQDFTQNGETYDLIFDVLNKSSFAAVRRSLTPSGRYMLVSFKMKQLRQMLWTSLRGGGGGRKRVICALSNERPEDLRFIKELIEAGKLKVVIDRCYPLAQAADAHRYIEAGGKKGSVVLMMEQPQPAL